MSTHISAEKGMIAPGVIMPGDPLRAAYIAENFLEAPVCFNKIRGMLGFTGRYKGKELSVMGSGMGMPSIGIYSSELFNIFGVKRIIRTGTCLSIARDVGLRDIILSTAASTDSIIADERFTGLRYSPCADFLLTKELYDKSLKLGIPVKPGPIFSSDKFYDKRSAYKNEALANLGIKAIDMESAELFTQAAEAGAQAATLLTVMDVYETSEACPPMERERGLDKMITLALEVI